VDLIKLYQQPRVPDIIVYDPEKEEMERKREFEEWRRETFSRVI